MWFPWWLWRKRSRCIWGWVMTWRQKWSRKYPCAFLGPLWTSGRTQISNNAITGTLFWRLCPLGVEGEDWGDVVAILVQIEVREAGLDSSRKDADDPHQVSVQQALLKPAFLPLHHRGRNLVGVSDGKKQAPAPKHEGVEGQEHANPKVNGS